MRSFASGEINAQTQKHFVVTKTFLCRFNDADIKDQQQSEKKNRNGIKSIVYTNYKYKVSALALKTIHCHGFFRLGCSLFSQFSAANTNISFISTLPTQRCLPNGVFYSLLQLSISVVKALCKPFFPFCMFLLWQICVLPAPLLSHVGIPVEFITDDISFLANFR